MWNVPNYQIIEFFEYLNSLEKKADFQDKDLLIKLARKFLTNYEKTRINGLKEILLVFQLCPMNNEDNILEEMRHFVGCGRCLDYLKEQEISLKNHQLHPVLKKFYKYLQESGKILKYEQDYLFDFREFRETLRRIGEQLLRDFEDFLENVNESEISNYLEEKRENRGKNIDKKRNKKIEGEIDIEARGIEEESKRLVESIENVIRQKDKQPRELYFLINKLVGEETPKILEFFNWLKEVYPTLNIGGNIPNTSLEKLVLEFSENKNYVYSHDFLKEVEKVFRNEANISIMDKIFALFFPNKKRNRTPTFARYKNIGMHGIFIYPSFGSEEFEDFIDETWQDLNHVTGEYMDIYYSSNDAKKRNGFDIFEDFKSFKNIKLYDLPALIIWDGNIENAIAIPIEGLSHKEKLKVVQYIVQGIKDKLSIDEITRITIDFINKKMEENNMKNKHIVNINKGDEIFMGDKIINNGIAGTIGGKHKNTKININGNENKNYKFSSEDISYLEALVSKIEEEKTMEKSDKYKVLGHLEEIKKNIISKDEMKVQQNINEWNNLKQNINEKSLQTVGAIADVITIGTFAGSLIIKVLGL